MTIGNLYIKDETNTTTYMTLSGSHTSVVTPEPQPRWVEHPIGGREGSISHYTGSNDSIITLEGVVDSEAARNNLFALITGSTVYYLNVDNYDSNISGKVIMLNFQSRPYKRNNHRFTLEMRRYNNP